jgi:hypothetical protein
MRRGGILLSRFTAWSRRGCSARASFRSVATRTAAPGRPTPPVAHCCSRARWRILTTPPARNYAPLDSVTPDIRTRGRRPSQKQKNTKKTRCTPPCIEHLAWLLHALQVQGARTCGTTLQGTTNRPYPPCCPCVAPRGHRLLHGHCMSPLRSPTLDRSIDIERCRWCSRTRVTRTASPTARKARKSGPSKWPASKQRPEQAQLETSSTRN